MTAKLLKEIGYNYETEKIWYDPYQYPQSDIPHFKAKLLWKDALNIDQKHWSKYQFPAPLQCVVQKYLREICNLHIDIHSGISHGAIEFCYIIRDLQTMLFIVHGTDEITYEIALEKALIKCLEIVKDKQKQIK